ncbi:MAG: PAS domain S-box protein [Candidatus Methanofastidiosa archaeon]|nr:PAS domain S-box protein [Candidatus Methanofastidiosa archaeon]
MASLLPAFLTRISGSKRTHNLLFDSTCSIKGADEAIMAKSYDAIISYLNLKDGKVLNLFKKKDPGAPLILLSDVDIDPKLLSKYGIRFYLKGDLDEQAAFNLYGMLIALASENEKASEAKDLADSLAQRDALLGMAGDLHLKFSKLSDMGKLYGTLYGTICNVMPCVSLTISKYEKAKNKIRCELSIVDGKVLDPSKFPLLDLDQKGKGNQSKVILTGKPLMTKEIGPSTSTDSKSYVFNGKKVLKEEGRPNIKDTVKSKYTLYVPIYQEGEIDGVLYISNYGKRPYCEDDVRALENIVLQFLPVRERIMKFSNLTTSNEEYKSLFQKAPMGYMSLNENGIITEVNEACLDLLGYEDEDMKGKWIGGFLTPASLEKFKTDFLRFKSQGHINDARISLINKHGDTTSLLIKGIMDFLGSRDELRANCLLLEIPTDDEGEMTALRASLLENTMALVLLIDHNGVIRHASGRLMGRLGISGKGLIGTHVLDMEAENPFGDWESFWQELSSKGHLTYEGSFKCQDGKLLPVLLCSDLFEKDGAEFELVVAADMSVAREREKGLMFNIERLERLMERRNNELDSSHVSMEEFAHASAHGLQEPLRDAINQLLLFRRKHGKSMGKDAESQLKRAIDDAKRLNGMLAALSAYADIKVDEDAFTSFGAVAPIEDAINSLEEIIKAKKADIRIADMPIIYADRRLASTIFQNLISNAISFSRPDEQPVVTISHKEDGGDHIFSVDDNGAGIAPEHHEDVFRIFSKVDRGSEGDGVGLAVCKRIIEGHGGRIWVEPKAGKGSMFKFTLPV